MTKFLIESTAGIVMGEYVAESKAEALDAMARECGYVDYAEVLTVLGKTDPSDLIVTEVQGRGAEDGRAL